MWCCFSPPPPSGGAVLLLLLLRWAALRSPSLSVGSAALGGPTFQSSFGVVVLLFGRVSSLLFGRAAACIFLLIWVLLLSSPRGCLASFFRWCCLPAPLWVLPLSCLLLRSLGLALSLSWTSALATLLGGAASLSEHCGSPWELTSLERQRNRGKYKTPESSVVGSWVLSSVSCVKLRCCLEVCPCLCHCL